MTIASLIVDVAANQVQLVRNVEQINGSLERIVGMATKVGAAIGIGFSASALFAFASGALEAADRLEKLKDKTGINVEALQRLEAIGDASGNTLEDLTGAVNKFQKRLAGGEDSALRALEELNLSLATLRRMEPDQQFMAIARAMATVKDPAEQVRLAVALFGKTGAEVLPSLKADVDKLASGIFVMSKQSSKALDDLGDAITRVWRNLKNLTGEVVGQMFSPRAADTGVMLEPLVTLQDLIEQMKGPGLAFSQAPIGAADAFELDRAYTKLNGTIHDQAQALKKTSDAQEKLDSQYRGFTNFVEERRIEEAKLNLEFENSAKHINAANLMYPVWTEALHRASNEARGLTYDGLIPLSEAMDESLTKMGMMARTTRILSEGASKLPSIFSGLGDTIRHDLGPTIMAALTGGGSVLKSAGGVLGGGLFGEGPGSLSGKIGDGLTKSLGSKIGGAIGSVIPVVGTLLGSLAGAGIGKLIGLFSGGEGKKVNDMRDQFIGAAGGLEVLAQKALAAGTNVDALLRANKVKDFEAAVAALQGKLGDFANEQAADAQRLTEAIQRYGFSFEELGPKLQNQRLHEQARELIEDWRVLVGAGIDIDMVSGRMAESMNNYLALALKTGAEVPVAMRPILDHMATLGVLTDADGQKITDVGALHLSWSETMTQGFDRVVQKLQELINRLQSTGTAISSIPRNVNVDIVERHRRIIEEQVVRDDAFQMFHGGGIVRAHAGLAVDEVPIIAQSGEGILSTRGMRALGELNAGRSPNDGVRAEIAALREDMNRDRRDMRRALTVGFRDALVMAGLA